MISVRLLLAISLLVGFYLLAVGFVVTDVALLVAVVPAMAAGGLKNLNPPLFFVVFGLGSMLIAVSRGVFVVSWSTGDPLRTRSIEVSDSEAPAIWSLVHDVVAQVGGKRRAKIRLRLMAEANAAVTEVARLLGFMPGQRCVYIGVPLLVGLSPDQLRAVLCHEFGHYTRRHTRFAGLVYRGACALDLTRERLRGSADTQNIYNGYSALGWWFFSRFATLYDRISLAVRRRQEFEADAEAARIVGTSTVVESLQTAHALAVAWTEFLSQYFEPIRRAGFVPADPFRVFRSMLDDPDYQARLNRLQTYPHRPSTPNDSHPTLPDRLAALDRLRLPSKPAPTLLAQCLTYRDEWAGRLGGTLLPLGSDDPAHVPTRQWLEILADLQAIIPASELQRAAGVLLRLEGTEAGIEDVLDLLASGHSDELAAEFGKRPAYIRTSGASVGLSDALFALIGRDLVVAGLATWQASWVGPNRLVVAGSTDSELAALAEAAVHRPSAVVHLRQKLVALRSADEVPASQPTSAASAVVQTAGAPSVGDGTPVPKRHMAAVMLATLVFATLVALGVVLGRWIEAHSQVSMLGDAIVMVGALASVLAISRRRRSRARAVAKLDPRTSSLVDRAGQTFQEIALDDNRDLAYVVAASSGALFVVDLSSGSMLASIEVGKGAVNVAVSPTGGRAFVSVCGWRGGRLVVVDTATNQIITTIQRIRHPRGMAMAPAGDVLFVTGMSDGRVWRLDPNAPVVTGWADVGRRPCDVAVSPDGRCLYVANFWSDSVSVVDVATLQTHTTVRVSGGPRRLALGPDGSRLYVTCGQGMLAIVDTKTNTVVRAVRVGETAEGVAVSASGDLVYVANPMGGMLVVLDARKAIPLTRMAFGNKGPIDVAVGGNGARVHVVTLEGTLEAVEGV